MIFIDTKGIIRNDWRVFRFTASKEGIFADFETMIYCKEEYKPWECYDLAERHGCEFWNIEELDVVKREV